jgi:hypothetical protein
LTGLKKDPVKPHATFQNLRTTPSVGKVTGGDREKERRRKNTINSSA